MNKSPNAAINGVVILSGSHPFWKLFKEISIVIGSIINDETRPATKLINIKSIRLILSKPNIIQINLAIIAKNKESTSVNIKDTVIFSINTSDFLNSGVKIPIWRFVDNLELNDPKIFPLIPIAPGIRTKSPGNVSRK